MCIFALNEGPFAPGFHIVFHYGDGFIHGAIDIRVLFLLCSFILNRATVIIRFQPVVGGLQVFSKTTFITGRPGYDAGKVFIAFPHPLNPVQVSILPKGIVRQGKLRGKAHAIAFNVGLIYHIQTVLIAQFIPAFCIGVMAGTNGIDVQLLHQPDVAQHVGFGNYLCSIHVVLMPVHPFYFDGPAIQQEQTVFDFNSSEPDSMGNIFYHISF
ncbi:hypothetical protein D3C87_1200140 [compost metagenome]